LNFNSGRKLSFACGSGVTIEAGGVISSDGGGASENIKICNTVVWQGSWDESLDGPVVLGSGLPIELVSFEANFKGENVDLTWTTATETDNDYFTLERSQDGNSFDKIAIVDGAGNSNAYLTYYHTDHSPLSGNSYYRLKQTDINGAYSYSKIVAVKSLGTFDNLLVYPNPTDASFQLALSGTEDEIFQVEISDLTGKLQFTKQFLSSSETHIETIDPSEKLAPGTYLVLVSSMKHVFTRKLIVK
jgi:hypothetical protein